jgi:hypothetical protein
MVGQTVGKQNPKQPPACENVAVELTKAWR